MATDPTQMFGALLGTLQQTGNIAQEAQQNADQQQAAKQQLTMGAIQLAAAQAQQRQHQQYQQDVQSYYADPTLERLSALAAKYPQQAAALKQSYDIMNEAQRQSALTQFGSLYNAADNNKPDLVRSQLQQLKTAEQKQGIDTSDIDQAVDAIDADPASAMRYIKGFAQLHLSAAGVDKFQLGDDQNHYSQFGSGGIFDQRTGQIVQQPADKPQYVWDSANSRFIQKPGTGGGGQASGGGGASGAPRNVRNNNPGNLKASPFTKKLPGFTGVDPDGFATFESPQAGANAQAALLKNYMNRGFNTVSKIISRWAPPGDHNDTSAYVSTVAGKLGVNPNDTLSPSMIPQLQAAITGVEGGANNPSNGPAQQSSAPQVINVPTTDASIPGDTTLSGPAYLATIPSKLATQAKALSEGRLPLPSSFALSKPYWQNLLQITAQYDPSFDAANAATRRSTRQFFTSGKGAQNITSFNTALAHLGVLDSSIDRLDNWSGVPFLNSTFNSVRNASLRSSGESQNLKNFESARQAVIDELERAFRGSSGTLEGIRGWEKQLSETGSPQELHAVVKQIGALLGSRIQALGEQYNSGMGRSIDPIQLLDPHAQHVLRSINPEAWGQTRTSITPTPIAPSGSTGGGAADAPVRVQTPAQAHSLPSGTLYIAPDGQVRRR